MIHQNQKSYMKNGMASNPMVSIIFLCRAALVLRGDEPLMINIESMFKKMGREFVLGLVLLLGVPVGRAQTLPVPTQNFTFFRNFCF